MLLFFWWNETQQIPQLDEEVNEMTSQDIVSEYTGDVNRSSAIHEEREVDMLSPRTTFSNLKEYVLGRNCEEEDIITYLCQVASGLCYLHDNHLVHGDLRAEHVHLTEGDKVGHLGRSRKLCMSADEDTSTSCVVKATMPPHSTRWSAPEVILDGHYTYASDVWAFGNLAWELYESFTTGHDKRDLSMPFYGLENREILSHLRNHERLSKPESCPLWVYIIMHQCWAYDPAQRPIARAILDCLKSRKPLRSWTMTYWANHSKHEKPDSSVRRSQDACPAVTDTNNQPSKENNYEANN